MQTDTERFIYILRGLFDNYVNGKFKTVKSSLEVVKRDRDFCGPNWGSAHSGREKNVEVLHSQEIGWQALCA